jgi:hypothetical protein
MTKPEKMPTLEAQSRSAAPSFWFCHSFVIRHSDFVIQ